MADLGVDDRRLSASSHSAAALNAGLMRVGVLLLLMLLEGGVGVGGGGPGERSVALLPRQSELCVGHLLAQTGYVVPDVLQCPIVVL